MFLLGYEGVKQWDVVQGEVVLLDSMFQTQQLTWDQRHLFHFPFSLKHRTDSPNWQFAHPLIWVFSPPNIQVSLTLNVLVSWFTCLNCDWLSFQGGVLYFISWTSSHTAALYLKESHLDQQRGEEAIRLKGGAREKLFQHSICGMTQHSNNSCSVKNCMFNTSVVFFCFLPLGA